MALLKKTLRSSNIYLKTDTNVENLLTVYIFGVIAIPERLSSPAGLLGRTQDRLLPKGGKQTEGRLPGSNRDVTCYNHCALDWLGGEFFISIVVLCFTGNLSVYRCITDLSLSSCRIEVTCGGPFNVSK